MNFENNETQTGAPLQADFPWNDQLRRARNGDAEALQRVFAAMQPYMERLSRVPYFAGRLGSDEIRSILALRLAEFVNSGAAVPEKDEEVPYLLKRILRFHLINVINKSLLHSKYEMSQSAVILPAGEPAGNFDALPGIRAAEPAEDPETACVRKDFRNELALLMGQLPGKERAVVQMLYMQQKTPAEAAKELHYSLRGLRNARQRALGRLRGKLTERFQNRGCKQILEELQWTK
jgi:DNA-directed RNA polymerase specialized sigma24 family protein